MYLDTLDKLTNLLWMDLCNKVYADLKQSRTPTGDSMIAVLKPVQFLQRVEMHCRATIHIEYQHYLKIFFLLH